MIRSFLRFLASVVLALLAPAAVAAGLPGQPDLLDPADAFRVEARAVRADLLEIRYLIAPGYYLYRDRLRFRSATDGVALDAPQFPPGKRKHDDFFGDVETYRGDLRIPVRYRNVSGVREFTLVASSQGCADAGVCYVPQEQKVVVRLAAAGALPVAGGANAGDASLFAAAGDDLQVARVFDRDAWVVVLMFFGFGLLLAFTPCVLPMVPILSGIIVGQGHRVTRAHGFSLSLAYVLGMALTYAVAGVLAGLSGALLSSALQNPWVLGSFAGLFVVLAGGMLGWYRLQVPQAAQSRLSAALNRLPGGRYAGVFVMGALSALIAGPCVAAPLAGALLYIGQSGNVALGGGALFAMALGMGVPLLLIGVSAGALLPRVGPWMQRVQRLFGYLLLGVALYFVSPLTSVAVVMGATALLLVFAGLQLGALHALPPKAGTVDRLGRAGAFALLVAGVAYGAGAVSGADDFRRPWSFLAGPVADTEASKVRFQRVDNLAELDASLRASAGRPVMLDFYADWCVSCKEMERDTFPNAAVRARLDRMLILQADVTANRDEHLALLKRFRLFGPPGIVFFDRQGREIDGLRVVGFQAPAQFSRVLDRVLGVP